MIDIRLPRLLQPTPVAEMVRVGKRGDGGYVIDRDLIEKTDVLVGLGLGFDWSFEKDFFRRAGGKICVHGYDHTISPKLLLFHSIKNFLVFSLKWKKQCFPISFLIFDYLLFFGEKGVDHFRERVHWREGRNKTSIKEVFRRSGDHRKLFLKMDIEGAEYEIIEEILENENILGMAMEFHDLNLVEDKFLSVISLLKEKFLITHLHLNNHSDIGRNGWPALVEMTFRSRKQDSPKQPVKYDTYPLDGLDYPNVPGLEDFRVSFE